MLRPRSRARSRILVISLAVSLAVGLTGCGGLVDRVRDLVHSSNSGGDSSTDDGPPPNTDIVDLAAGDCFLDSLDDVPTAVDRVPCDSDHENEVTGTVPVPGTNFPGDLRVDKLGQIACRDSLVDYVGRDFATSSLDYWYFVPDSKAWNGGNHSVTCYAYSWEGDELESSVKGSKL